MYGVLSVILVLAAVTAALRSDEFRLAEPVGMLLFGILLFFLGRTARKHLPRGGGQPS